MFPAGTKAREGQLLENCPEEIPLALDKSKFRLPFEPTKIEL